MDNKTLQEEKAHLEITIDKIKKAEDAMEKSLQALGATNLDQLKEMRNDPVTSATDFLMYVQQLHEKNESFNIKDKVKRLEEMNYLIKEPYFARLDLKDAKEQESIYIGKFGYTEDIPVVIDWRAKIASIYYRYRYPQKNVKYSTPSGDYVRDLVLKRTFEIDNSELIKYYNNDLQLDEDTVIAEKIEHRTGGVLEDIVETIQESQLDIIESDPRKICIVQGSVGSGKSTVAIHKLSHIFFNFPTLVSPDRAILVAKSGVLVSYLATLFPKLGIFDVNYKTLRELVVNVIFREEVPYKFNLDKNETTAEFDLKKIRDLEVDLHKLHEDYRARINSIQDQEDFASFSSFVYNREQSIQENILEFISDLNEELLFQKEKLKDNPKTLKSWIYRENIVNLRKLISKLQKLKADVKEDALNELCQKWGVNLKEELDYLSILIYLVIHHELFGFNVSLKYQYCVVDEGQDFSVLEYLVLGKLVTNGRFCILGDLNQSYLDEGLTTWDAIKEVIHEAKEAQTFELSTNYRSTKQIIAFANSILKPYTQEYLPKSIERLGPEPATKQFDKINDMLEKFEKDIKEDLKNVNKSIGIVCFGEDNYATASAVLGKLQNELKIPEDKFIYLNSTRRISYMPKAVYVSLFEDCKGLEFAKVYVLGLNLDNVSNFQQAKKAFVAVTRAMNEVVVYGTQN